MNFKNAIFTLVIGVTAVIQSGCSMIYDDMPECSNDYRLLFTDRYNLLDADAFDGEVGSVSVWAFDESGHFVWSDTNPADDPERSVMSLPSSLQEGTYQFVVWGGLTGQNDFHLASQSPETLGDLDVSLVPANRGASIVSEGNIGPLFHALVKDVRIERDPARLIDETITVPLVKDTHHITVILSNTDSSPIDTRLDVSIEADYSALDYDNSRIEESPAVEYLPWKTGSADAVIPDGHGGTTTSKSAAFTAQLTVARLFENGQEPRLRISRGEAGNKRLVADLPLISTILLGKGRYEDMPPQEYLDRCGEWTFYFFMDPDKGWQCSPTIYINNWAVVPPQIVEP